MDAVEALVVWMGVLDFRAKGFGQSIHGWIIWLFLAKVVDGGKGGF